MADYKVLGAIDPILEAHLDRNEEILAESGAMVSMDTTLELIVKA